MEFTWSELISPVVSWFRKIGPAKRHGRDVELLLQKSEYLYDMRDFVKEEKIKELMLGSIQTNEYQKWLYKESEIESRVNDILKLHKGNSNGVLFPCIKSPRGDLMNALNEVTCHLENLPWGDGSASHASNKTATAIINPQIKVRTYGQVERTKDVREKRKAESKGESNVEVHAQRRKAAQGKEMPRPRGNIEPSVDGHEKNVSVTGPETHVFTKVLDDSVARAPQRETKTLTSPRVGTSTYGQIEKVKTVKPKRKVERKGKSSVRAHAEIFSCSPSSFRDMVKTISGSTSVSGVKGELTYGISGDFQMPSETVPTAVTKSLIATDHVPASNVEPVAEEEVISPPQTDCRSVHESEIQHTSCEVEVEPLVHAAGTLETISDGNERMLPIHGKEFKIVPSQNEGSSTARVATFISGPSIIAAVEMPLVDKAESEISSKTERVQWLHELGLAVNQSTERTVLKIFQCISGVEAGKVGIHGVGGIGKTTVLKALISYPKTKQIFDIIILVSVSRYWSVRKIQNDVLRQLSLYREDSEADSEVAEKLFQVLKGKKLLLLLDDVWVHINLEAVGIPDPSSENGCKIVMASRTVGVCFEMDVSKLIEVETVSSEEAWELFYEQAGGVIELPHIRPFAQTIVEGCGGLPLLIIVTGRALVEENNVLLWEHASKQFSKSIGNAMNEDVIQLLKFGFDQLKDYDTKSCFLYSSLFPEDKEVNIFEFIEKCIQEGVIAGSLGDARKRGQDIIDILVSASLLQVNELGDFIKMHDLIRDLALGILSISEGRQFLLRAYSRLTEPSNPGNSSSSSSRKVPEGRLFIPEDHHFLLRAGAGLTEPPSLEEWEQAEMIFLMDNVLCTLPERPICSKLSALYLQQNYQLKVIPMSFFQFMTSLKILNLSKTRIKSLPNSLFELKNLQILILRDCERLAMLPSEVGSLENLEVLDLRGTEISKLPDDVGGLTSLSHLEVYFYGSINYTDYVKLPQELISSGILSRLRALEKLSIVVYPGDKRWYKDVKSVVTEVCNLTELSSLCFHFPEVELLELFLQRSIAWNAQRLTEFKFVVGHDVKNIVSRVPDSVAFDYNKQYKCLRFINGENTPEAFLQILACSTALYLENQLGINSLSDFDVRNMNALKFCIISECPKIETIVDSKELTIAVFPSLENLSIHHLWNLILICEGIVANGSFARLRILSVHACPKLKFVFSSFMIQFMSSLEDLTVEDCPAIEEIISEGEIIDSGSIALPRLKKLTLRYLPGLVNIWKRAWPSLEYASFYDCPKLKMIGLDSKVKHSIIEIKAEKSWWDDLEWEDTELQLHLQNCFSTISEDDL